MSTKDFFSSSSFVEILVETADFDKIRDFLPLYIKEKTMTTSITKPAKIRWNLKDSVFTSIFSEKENIASLYRALTGMEIKEEEIGNVTSENVFFYGLYNDLSFTVNGRELYLIEAQSTACPNIPLRFNEYFMKAVETVVPSYNVRKYMSSPITDIPSPCFITIYTGKAKMPEEIDTDIFFQGKALKIRVKILTKHNSKGIIRAYIVFTEKYDEMRSLYGATVEAVKETIDYCLKAEETKELRKYLLEHKKEVENIMMDSNKQEELMNELYDYYDKLARENRFEGRLEGKAEGIAEGKDNTLKKLKKYLMKTGISEELQDTVYNGFVASLG